MVYAAQEGAAHDAAGKPFALSPGMRAKVAAAQTAEDMHLAVGQDCWVVVPIASAAQPGLVLEGSRLTLVCTLFVMCTPNIKPFCTAGGCQPLVPT